MKGGRSRGLWNSVSLRAGAGEERSLFAHHSAVGRGAPRSWPRNGVCPINVRSQSPALGTREKEGSSFKRKLHRFCARSRGWLRWNGDCNRRGVVVTGRGFTGKGQE